MFVSFIVVLMNRNDFQEFEKLRTLRYCNLRFRVLSIVCYTYIHIYVAIQMK